MDLSQSAGGNKKVALKQLSLCSFLKNPSVKVGASPEEHYIKLSRKDKIRAQRIHSIDDIILYESPVKVPRTAVCPSFSVRRYLKLEVCGKQGEDSSKEENMSVIQKPIYDYSGRESRKGYFKPRQCTSAFTALKELRAQYVPQAMKKQDDDSSAINSDIVEDGQPKLIIE